MLNFQKLLLISSFCVAPIIAMENDKAIIPIFAKASIGTANKPIFVPTGNTPQANADLLKILALRQTRVLQEEDWENIRKCLENDADPNLKSADSLKTPLVYLAAAHDKKELFECLLQLGADINAHDAEGWTPLHIFIFNFPNTPTNLAISYLLQEGAKPNAINKSKETPFTCAVQYNCLDFIQPLIQNRANVNHNDSITTPLGWAITTSIDNTKLKIIDKIVKMLCKAGASAINLDSYNRTAFHLAAKRPKKIIKTLLTHIKFKNNDDDKIKNTIKTFLLVFNRLNNDPKFNIYKIPHIPHEIQILILSKLLSVHTFHEGLYKQCKGKNYQQLPLKFVNEHVQHLKQILQMKNNSNFNATAEKTKLLDGSKLQEDLDIFNEVYPDIALISENNLARQIFENLYS